MQKQRTMTLSFAAHQIIYFPADLGRLRPTMFATLFKWSGLKEAFEFGKHFLNKFCKERTKITTIAILGSRAHPPICRSFVPDTRSNVIGKLEERTASEGSTLTQQQLQLLILGTSLELEPSLISKILPTSIVNLSGISLTSHNAQKMAEENLLSAHLQAKYTIRSTWYESPISSRYTRPKKLPSSNSASNSTCFFLI